MAVGKSSAQLDAESGQGGGKKKNGAKVLQSGRDGGTKQLREKIDEMGALHIGHSPEKVARVQNLVQVPIDYYAQRGWLTKRQYDAAEEFHRCWYYGAVKSPHGVSRYDTQGGGGRRDAFDVDQQLHEKHEKAKKAIRGLPQALTCFNVVCIGEWASALSPRKLKFDAGDVTELDELRPFYGRREEKMAWLRSALDDLADHWRMPA